LRVLQRRLDRWWFQTVIRHCIDRHLVVSDNLAEELSRLGVETEVVPLVSEMIGEVVPLPKLFTVLAYLPEGRGEFYGAPVVYELAARHPSWRFLILGRAPTARGLSLPNVTEFDRWLDMHEVYPEVSALVRPTAHDGLPRMVLEALSWGRYVVFSRPFPHCLLGQTKDEVEAALVELCTRSEPNHAGSRHVHENYTHERTAAALASVFKQVLSDRAVAGEG
jgi:glycosyltransferase involved in cell wall biosynthesis